MLSNHEVSLASNPIDLRIKRSRVAMHKTVSDTFDSGTLVPIYWRAVLPGTTISMSVNSFVRMNTPLHPVMDSADIDIVAFSTPLRLLWTHWVNLRGENSNTYWETPTEYTVPQTTSPASTGWNIGTVADKLGYATGVPGYSISSLPFRCYAMIWNEWWRSESISQPVAIDTGDSNSTGENASASDYVTKGTLGGALLPVARYHDLFSSALLEPQAGEAVTIPVGSGEGLAPVLALDPSAGSFTPPTPYSKSKMYDGMKWAKVESTTPSGYYTLADIGNTAAKWSAIGIGGKQAIGSNDQTTVDTLTKMTPKNLYAMMDLVSGNVGGISINDLRNSFAVQHVLEGLNRGGTRYKELLEGLFGVRSPDARLQRPELLGMRRFPVMIQEINQTSSTDSTSPLGTPGANSKTFDFDNQLFQHSFVEDSLLMICACVRHKRTYAQGVPMWARKRTRWDFFYPMMQGLGDRPVPNSMIYMQADTVVDSDGNVVNDLPFGYQQAWFEEFTDYNEVRGLFRPQASGTLASWNYADKYDSLPQLSHSWLYDKGNIARTISVQNQPEFNAQFEFNSVWTLPMTVGRAPGLSVL